MGQSDPSATQGAAVAERKVRNSLLRLAHGTGPHESFSEQERSHTGNLDLVYGTCLYGAWWGVLLAPGGPVLNIAPEKGVPSPDKVPHRGQEGAGAMERR